jgi:peptide/nickel transport system substrate-binding protein
MQAIIRDEGATVIPMFANYVFAASDKLKHGDLASNLDVDGYKFAERWWFA